MTAFAVSSGVFLAVIILVPYVGVFTNAMPMPCAVDLPLFTDSTVVGLVCESKQKAVDQRESTATVDRYPVTSFCNEG